MQRCVYIEEFKWCTQRGRCHKHLLEGRLLLNAVLPSTYTIASTHCRTGFRRDKKKTKSFFSYKVWEVVECFDYQIPEAVS